MDRSAPTELELSPWIESLILDYSGPEEEQRARSDSSSSGWLRARVVAVGQMSMSQIRARGSDGPIELLFLSDGVLQIPAVLTAAAWDYLQEQEDRESFDSFLNTNVLVQDYRLRFHMDTELTKCRFFLSVGEVTTCGAGQFQDDSPCCTTLPSIRTKICQTWKSLLGQEDSQKSQCGLDLSELLEVWQQDCLHAVLEDVQNRLMNPPQLSTPSLNWSRSSWDVERVQYRSERPFRVPVKFLLIPEGPEFRTQTGPESVDDADWQVPDTAGVEPVYGPVETSPVPEEDNVSQEDMTHRPLSNPWDMFSPPCITSSSKDSSPEPTPDHPGASSGPSPGASSEPLPGASSEPLPGASSTSGLGASSTPGLGASSTPGPGVSSGPGPGATSGPDPVANGSTHSLLPPYQNPLTCSLPVSSSTSSIQGPADPPASDGTHIPAGLQTCSTLDWDHKAQKDPGYYRKPKRKQCDVTPEKVRECEGPSQSPPSWLFETQTFRTEEGSSPKQAVPRRTPDVHEDGMAFSYTYTVSGQNLLDFSRFRVAEPVLLWALRYLLTPEPTEGPPDVH